MSKLAADVSEGVLRLTARGYEQTRGFLVTGLSGTAHEQMRDALEHAGVPAIGDAHPSITDIYAVGKTATPGDGTSCRVDVQYAVPTPEELPGSPSVSDVIQLDSSLVSETTIEDINGTRLSVTFSGYPTVTNLPQASVQKPLFTITVERTETSLAFALARDMVGKVNSLTWSGYPPKTWRVDDIRSRAINRNQSYSVSYVLTYNPETWQFEARFFWAGQVPSGATVGDGIVLYDVLQLADFSALPFTVPGP